MDNSQAAVLSFREQRGTCDEMLLREANHRFSNDLQLIVSLLELQSRRAKIPAAREALIDAKQRVAVLARARSTMQQRDLTLRAVLEQLCNALKMHAEPRGIAVTLEIGRQDFRIAPTQIPTLALIVNELATNAIKHAFEGRSTGQIRVSVQDNGDGAPTITVDDDGLPFPDLENPNGGGFGLALVRRMAASIGASITFPAAGTKRFEIMLPLGTA